MRREQEHHAGTTAAAAAALAATEQSLEQHAQIVQTFSCIPLLRINLIL